MICPVLSFRIQKYYPTFHQPTGQLTKIEIQLEGHTDSQGNASANMELSQDRVEAAKKYLVSKGIDKGRVKTKAFGGTQPLSNEKTEEALALNRRVEMRVLKN